MTRLLELKSLADVYNLTASQTLESELEVAWCLFIDKENFTKTNDVFLRLCTDFEKHFQLSLNWSRSQ